MRDKTTISRILPPLFRKGMLIKEKNPTDARSYVIKVHEKVKELIQETLVETKKHYQTKVFAGLTAEEQAELLRLIVKLRKSLGDL